MSLLSQKSLCDTKDRNASRIFPHSHLKLNANENVRYIQEKK